MHRALTAAVTGLCAAVVISTSGRTQSLNGDTLPFRKGQWAVEFPLQESYSITLLRFGSNRHALLVDGVVSITHDKSAADDDEFDSRLSGQSYRLRIGRRAYRPLAANTAGYFDYGVVPGWSRVASDQLRSDRVDFESNTRTSSLGVFAALGGNYFVTPR